MKFIYFEDNKGHKSINSVLSSILGKIMNRKSIEEYILTGFYPYSMDSNKKYKQLPKWSLVLSIFIGGVIGGVLSALTDYFVFQSRIHSLKVRIVIFLCLAVVYLGIILSVLNLFGISLI